MIRKLYAGIEKLECVWTGRPLQAADTDNAGFAVDHVIPFSLWHSNELWNLLPSDSRVNGQIVIVAEFKESEPGQVAVKRYQADSDAWVFTSDNPNRDGIRLEKTSVDYPILGTYIAKLP